MLSKYIITFTNRNKTITTQMFVNDRDESRVESEIRREVSKDFRISIFDISNLTFSRAKSVWAR